MILRFGNMNLDLIDQERKAHLTNAVIGDPVRAREGAGREGIVSFAGCPLIVEDRLVGVIAMFARHPLTDALLDALAPVAAAIAQGIERRRAEEKLRARARQQAAVAQLGQTALA